MAFVEISDAVLEDLTYGRLPKGTAVQIAKKCHTQIAGKRGIIDSWWDCGNSYIVVIEGEEWYVSSYFITHVYWDDNDGNDELDKNYPIPHVTVEDPVKEWELDGVEVGDIVIFHRGKNSFDICVVRKPLDEKGRPFCTVINGHRREKSFRYDLSRYVCKLPEDRFS